MNRKNKKGAGRKRLPLSLKQRWGSINFKLPTKEKFKELQAKRGFATPTEYLNHLLARDEEENKTN